MPVKLINPYESSASSSESCLEGNVNYSGSGSARCYSSSSSSDGSSRDDSCSSSGSSSIDPESSWQQQHECAQTESGSSSIDPESSWQQQHECAQTESGKLVNNGIRRLLGEYVANEAFMKMKAIAYKKIGINKCRNANKRRYCL